MTHAVPNVAVKSHFQPLDRTPSRTLDIVPLASRSGGNRIPCTDRLVVAAVGVVADVKEGTR